MKNRDGIGQGKVAEKSTGQSGPMPYHRAAEQLKEQQRVQASLAEAEQKTAIRNPKNLRPTDHLSPKNPSQDV